ncbi:outer-membrane lipoprotein LolB [Marinobacterium nitratireducens]|uniref:Outer-membrane lipoprotein LolB n=1 Tax=Marinobacterium nitratireducens TaxID=518897 RepID=A0A917ZMY4_9GAMM|nr:lipoprotein insertase outer membrane protein LolB [Marinobacterium nitratireducens]GGO86605.1 outer-membrane lipoprotein LolB [Marinobacterium nitratireducens]
MRRLLLLCLTLTLAGCGAFKAQPPLPATGSWEDYQQRVAALQQWSLDGKVGIRTADDSHSARLQWQQQPGDYRILISGPLGQGGARIDGNDQGVIIDVAGEGRFSAQSPEELLQQLLGWSFPVRQANYWVRGLPAPGLSYTPTFLENRLASLEQGGWIIHYSAYAKDGGPGLPLRIRLQRSDLTIMVVIKEWELPAASNTQTTF